jgi:hypothetical protein
MPFFQYSDWPPEAAAVSWAVHMTRTNLFFKVEMEHAKEDTPERLGEEIARVLRKLYGVRDAEMTSFTKVEE